MGESSLLAGVLALGDSTDDLRSTVADSFRNRRVLQVLVTAMLLVIAGQTAYGFIVYQRLERVSQENHALLTTAQNLTNPGALAATQQAADARAARIEYCTANRVQNILNPATTLDSRCPVEWESGVPNSLP